MSTDDLQPLNRAVAADERRQPDGPGNAGTPVVWGARREGGFCFGRRFPPDVKIRGIPDYLVATCLGTGVVFGRLRGDDIPGVNEESCDAAEVFALLTSFLPNKGPALNVAKPAGFARVTLTTRRPSLSGSSVGRK